MQENVKMGIVWSLVACFGAMAVLPAIFSGGEKPARRRPLRNASCRRNPRRRR